MGSYWTRPVSMLNKGDKSMTWASWSKTGKRCVYAGSKVKYGLPVQYNPGLILLTAEISRLGLLGFKKKGINQRC